MATPKPSPIISANESVDDVFEILDLSKSLNSEFSHSTDCKPLISVFQPTWRTRYFKGWRLGLCIGVVLSFITVCTSLGVMIYITQSQTLRDGPHAILERGSCDHVRRLNSLGHLLIALLSTALLSSTNYSLQCLSAPTRKEVDQAHQKSSRKWLDIGVMSVRNIASISHGRRLLWCLLILTSTPLHIFSSSTLYRAIDAKDYNIISAPETALNHVDKLSSRMSNGTEIPNFKVMQNILRNSKMARLENEQCIKEYATAYYRPGGILYQSNMNATSRNIETACARGAVNWICGICEPIKREDKRGFCLSQIDMIKTMDWRPFGYRVRYCLSEAVEEQCELRISTKHGWIFTTISTIKFVLLILSVMALKENPLLTMGDAVASFLTIPDETTRQFSVLARKDKSWWNSRAKGQLEPYIYQKQRTRWVNSLGITRWISTLILCTLPLVVSFMIAMHPKTGLSNFWKQGIGAIVPDYFVNQEIGLSDSGFAQKSILANIPQLLLSAVYFAYNGVFTIFLLSDELNRYAKQRRGLRVSSTPVGAQRSRYFLQLPYTYAVPLTLTSGVLYWLCSQSLFVVSIRVTELRNSLNLAGEEGFFVNILTCAYSPLALFILCVLLSFMILALLVFSQKTFKGNMPIAGSCSASISALCHVPYGEDGELSSQMPLKWGLSGFVAGKQFGGMAMHCSFSSMPVGSVGNGQKCASYRRRVVQKIPEAMDLIERLHVAEAQQQMRERGYL